MKELEIELKIYKDMLDIHYIYCNIQTRLYVISQINKIESKINILTDNQ